MESKCNKRDAELWPVLGWSGLDGILQSNIICNITLQTTQEMIQIHQMAVMSSDLIIPPCAGMTCIILH